MFLSSILISNSSFNFISLFYFYLIIYSLNFVTLYINSTPLLSILSIPYEFFMINISSLKFERKFSSSVLYSFSLSLNMKVYGIKSDFRIEYLFIDLKYLNEIAEFTLLSISSDIP